MFNSKKSQYGRLLSTFLRFFLLVIFASPAAAVDFNDFTFLIYNPGGDQASIVDAMEKILDRDLEENEIRTAEPGKHMTPNDLATHDILILWQ